MISLVPSCGLWESLAGCVVGWVVGSGEETDCVHGAGRGREAKLGEERSEEKTTLCDPEDWQGGKGGLPETGQKAWHETSSL